MPEAMLTEMMDAVAAETGVLSPQPSLWKRIFTYRAVSITLISSLIVNAILLFLVVRQPGELELTDQIQNPLKGISPKTSPESVVPEEEQITPSSRGELPEPIVEEPKIQPSTSIPANPTTSGVTISPDSEEAPGASEVSHNDSIARISENPIDEEATSTPETTSTPPESEPASHSLQDFFQSKGKDTLNEIFIEK